MFKNDLILYVSLIYVCARMCVWKSAENFLNQFPPSILGSGDGQDPSASTFTL